MISHRWTVVSATSLACVALAAAPAAADGRNPASLLVFPEFDATAGHDTLLTLTNSNASGGPVDVSLVYVRGTGSATSGLCLHTDFVVTLTPNDTFTTLASSHVSGQRGYAYAFAVDERGHALSFNHLLGDLTVTDGLFALDYSVNPLGFAAVPSFGLPTDLDHDGVRDLDGREYEAAPDTILIPRFLGQSPTFHSDLVLVHLSGGALFDVIVDFLAFNDNEEAFSAQYEFNCWAKVPLSSISGVFARDFLANFTNDASAEILGAPANEAGWIRVDGNIAQSSQRVIVDPAILAVLVEGASGSGLGAELPFLHGTQDNGALLPLGAQGDVDQL